MLDWLWWLTFRLKLISVLNDTAEALEAELEQVRDAGKQQV